MWRRTWARIRHRTVEPREAAGRATAAADLWCECEAFLAGRYDEHLATANRPRPAWARINRLAHGSLADVRALAGSEAGDDPSAVVSSIAREVLRWVGPSETALHLVQRRTLVPLESALAALGPRCVPADDTDLAFAVELALAMDREPLPDPGLPGQR